jgi:hypothetical protein
MIPSSLVYRYLPNRVHGITVQKTVILTLTVVRSLKLCYFLKLTSYLKMLILEDRFPNCETST